MFLISIAKDGSAESDRILETPEMEDNIAWLEEKRFLEMVPAYLTRDAGVQDLLYFMIISTG
jgi:hypothetical protein